MCPSRLTALLFPLLAVILILPFEVAAQSAAPYLSIDVTEISADGGAIMLTPKNSAFIGSDEPSLVEAGRSYPAYFDSAGGPRQAFLDDIDLIGAPVGMVVTGATVFQRARNVHGVGPDNFHREVQVTVAASSAPLITDAAATVRVSGGLLLFLNADGDFTPGTTSLSAPIKISRSSGGHPLEFADIPINLAEGGGTAGYRTALRNDPGNGNTVIVNLTSTDPGAATVAPARLSFTGGNMGSWQTPRRITVTPVDDDDGADEALYIEHAISGLGSVTSGGSVRVAVTDGDDVGVLVSRPHLAFYSNQSRGARHTYELRLATPPGAAVDVTVASSSTSRVGIAQVNGQSVGTASPTLTFAEDEWNQPQTVTLALGSAFPNNPVTISHTVVSQDADYGGITAPAVVVTYLNSGDPIEFTDPRVSMSESGSGQYALALRRDPGSGRTVVVTATVDHLDYEIPAATVSPSTFTFTGGSNGSWSTAQTARVTPIPDNNSDHENFIISHAISGLSNVTDGGDVTVSIADNVSAGLVIEPSLVTTQRDVVTNYSVRLRTRPVARRFVRSLFNHTEERYTEVSVDIFFSDRNKVRPADIRATPFLKFNSNDWNVPKSVEVTHGGSDGATSIFHTVTSNYGEIIDGDSVLLRDEDYHNLTLDLTAEARPAVASSEPRAVLSVAPAAVSEGGNATATVNLVGGNAPASARIIPLIYTNGSAADADYTPVGTVRVLANQRSASATVAIADDKLSEGAETFTIALGELPFGVRPPAAGETGSVEVTIAASDKPTIGITADAARVNEGGTAGFTITAGNAAQADIAVELTVNREGAYVDSMDAGNKTVVLSAGATTLDYDISTLELASDDPSGSVSVALRASSGYTIDTSVTSAKTEIVDTDATTVALASGAANIAEAAGDTTVTLTLGRGLVAGEVLSLPLTVGGAAARDTDYRLTEPQTPPAGVTYDLGNATPTVTFTGPDSGATAGSASFVLTAVQDALDEGSGETVSFALPVLNAGSGTGLDGGVSGSGSASITIDDDDDQPEVSIQGPANALTEGADADFTISVAGAAQEDLTINLTTTQVGDFVSASDTVQKTLTLASGATSLTHTISTLPDSDDERSGSLTVTLNDGAGYAIASGAGAATVAVNDDDATGVTLSASTAAINESGGSKTVTVMIDRGLVDGEILSLPLRMGGSAILGGDYGLSAPSSQPRGVSYANLASTDPINDPPTLTFTGGATPTATSATITLRATSDNLDEGASESVTIDLPTLDGNSGTGLDAGASGSGSVSFNITDDDAEPVIRLVRQGGSGAITEGENVVFSITANNPSDRNLGIAFNVTDTGDFLPTSAEGGQEIVLEAGQTNLAYTLATAIDVTDERSGSVAVGLVDGDGYSLHSSQSSSTVTVNDDDATLVTLGVPPADISEGGAKTITVTLARGLVGTESLPVRLKFAGNAAFGTDYTLTEPSPRPAGVSYSNLSSNPPTITFNGQSGGGATSATLILNAAGDTLVESAESVSVALAALSANTGSNLHGGARGTGSGGFSINDGNGAPQISVSAGADAVEGMPANFTVRSSVASERSLRVNLSVTQTGSFVHGDDLTAGKTVVIPARATSASYAVPTLADGADEADGRVTLAVDSGPGYTVSSSAGAASVNVTDDDSTAVTLAATDTTATEGDSDATGGFRVSLSRALVSNESLTVPVQVVGAINAQHSLALTAAATGIGLSGANLTFTGGASAASTANLTYSALADADSTSEIVMVSIPRSSASGSPRMTAAGLGGGAVGAGTARIVVTDTTGDPGGVTIQPGTGVTLDEGGRARYRVVLDSDPGNGATVVITPMSNNTDVSFMPASLTFTGGDSGDWNTYQTVTLEAAEDPGTEPDYARETATISHQIVGYTGVTSAPSVTVTIIDAGDGFIVKPERVSVVAGQTVEYTIRLKSQPGNNVLLDLASGSTSVATVQPAAITIMPSEWNMPVTVTVTGVAEGDTSISHDAEARTRLTGYRFIALPDVAVTVFAAAQPQLSIAAGASSVTEGADASFTISSDVNAPLGGLDVSLAVEQQGDFASGALPTSATIPEGQMSVAVAIPTTNETGAAGDEPDGSLTLSLQAGADYGLTSSATATVALVDNDPTSVSIVASTDPQNVNIAETGDLGRYRIELGRALVAGETLSVPLSIGGTATLGTDYRQALRFRSTESGVSAQGLGAGSPSISFTGGPGSSNRASLSVSAVSDLLDDDDETVVVSLGALNSNSGSGLSGGAVAIAASSSFTFTIVDDDGDAGPVISIAAGNGVNEGGAASFTVNASPAPAADLTVNLNIGQMGNYVASANVGMRQVTINAGGNSATHTVATTGDSVGRSRRGQSRPLSIRATATRCPKPAPTHRLRSATTTTRRSRCPPAPATSPKPRAARQSSCNSAAHSSAAKP